MSPERFEKIEKIFDAALDLPDRERDAFLVRECEDEAMLGELRAMLKIESSATTSLGDAAADLAAEMIAENDTRDFPAQINQYSIIRLLGVGGMGKVLLAEDSKLARRVALKILDGELASDAQRLNRFIREARAVSALNHPNILTVHEIGEYGDGHFIVTEYIDGETLSAYIRTQRPELDRRLDVAVQIASALAAAHDAGIVHRDVKPDNVMIRRDGIVKVLDFGIAKLIEESAGRSEVSAEDPTVIGFAGTIPGMIIGTPQYMSPEQARGGAVDARSDIFSFGVVLYEMIAGRPPFQGETNMDVIGSILRDTPNPVRTLNGEIPEELERIVAKALRKNRDERYQSIRDLLVDLKDVKRAVTPGASTFSGTDQIIGGKTTAATSAGFSNRARFSLLQVAIFVALIAAVGGLVWYFMPSRSVGPAASAGAATVTEFVSWASIPGESYSGGAFSPDGKMIAFTSTRSGRRSIWVKQVAGGEPIQATKDEFDNEQPVWSPSGDEIAFFSTRGNRTGIWRTPMLGGVPRFVATVEDGTALLRSWSKSDMIYFDVAGALLAVNAAGGDIRIIAEPENIGGPTTSLVVSRDEKSVAFVTLKEDKWTIWANSIPPGEPRRVTDSSSEIKNLAWRADSNRILYSQLASGTFQVFEVDASGGQTRQLTFGDRDNFALETSPDGSRLLLGSAKEDSDIWRLDLATDKETVFASDINFELWASVANDNKSVAYQSVKTMSQGNNLLNGRILARKIDSADPAAILASEGYLAEWSPDASQIAFLSVAGKTHRLMVAPAAGGQPQTVASSVTPPAYAILPYNRLETGNFTWSPDGARLAYVNRSSGAPNVFSVRPDGSDNAMLTANDNPRASMTSPLWSPDGSLLAFKSVIPQPGAKALYAISIRNSSGEIREMTRQSAFLRLLGWQKGSGKLIAVTTSESEATALHPEVTILAIDPATGNTAEMRRLKNVYLANIHLSPDGKSLAFVANNDGRDDVWLVPATGGAARKMTANNDGRLYFSSLSWSPDGQFLLYGKQSRYSLLSILAGF